MQCTVSRTHHRGALIEVPISSGDRGHLDIREVYDQARRRTLLVACLLSDRVFGKKGGTRMAPRVVGQPLFDVRLLHLSCGTLVITGIERTNAELPTEYAQTWHVRLVDGGPNEKPPSLNTYQLDASAAPP